MSTTRTKAFAALGIAAVTALSACNGGSNLGNSSTTTTTTTTTDTSASGGASASSTDTGSASSTDTGSASSGSNGAGSNVIINTFNGQQSAMTRNFNPYSPGQVSMVGGPIYESLFYINPLKPIDQKPIPLLGTDFSWNSTGTELTVHTQPNVKWSDGQAFSAKDVAFTLNMIQKDKTINASGTAPTATATDDHTVVIKYKKAAFADGYSTLTSTWVVPEHIWKDIKSPSTDPNPNPVGTGPFMLGDFTPQSFLLKANPTYWQAGKPKIGGVRVMVVSGNQSATDLWTAGQIDYMSTFIGNLDTLTKGKPNLAYTNTGTGQASIYTCSNASWGCTGPQTDVAVRQAMNLAIGRQQISNLAFSKLGGQPSPSYAFIERDKDFIDPSVAPSSMTADTAGAKKILEDAGYTLGSDGIYAKNGTRVSMTFKVCTGWTDYISAVDIMRQQLKAAGIEIVPQQVSINEWNAAKSSGKFNLLIDGLGQGPAPDPYYVYNQFFNTAGAMKVGQNGQPYGNSSRYSNAAVDAAIAKAGGTTDASVKKAQYAIIQKQISKDLPYIPIVVSSGLTEYNTSKVTGWPTADNLYAYPMSWAASSNAQVLMNIQPK